MKTTMLALLLLALAPGTAMADKPGDKAANELVSAARSQIGVTLRYDPRYEKLAYPNGDVPLERGVCTDVVIRAYRVLGTDLQALVHEDMRRSWSAYPKAWGLKGPDRNIDHRRVPNLQTYLQRQGAALTPSRDALAYQAGDIVTWRLPPNLPHIGIVSDQRSPTGTPLIIHNIGAGTRMEDMLFSSPVTGHYRWRGASASRSARLPSDNRSGTRP